MSTAAPKPPSYDGQPKRLLVTGGAGFIGSHLVDALIARYPGCSVTVIDDLSTGRRENLGPALFEAERSGSSIHLIQSTVEDALPGLADDPGFDRIIHLAAAVGVRRVVDDPIACIETNVDATAAILRYAVEHASPPTLIASSSEVYGKSPSSPFKEDDDCLYGPTTAPRWSYAASKAIDEYLALAHHRRSGLPVVIVRFFNTVGPRQLGDYGMVLPRFVQAALSGQALTVYGDGRQTRCFCDVRDTAPALIDLLDAAASGSSPVRGHVFNLGSDQPISIADLAARVIEWVGSSSRIELVPMSEAMGADFEDLSQRRPSLDRVRSVIDFEPKIQLRQTVEDIAHAVRYAQSSSTLGAR
jgi:UDP-glucose 4-epimerase